MNIVQAIAAAAQTEHRYCVPLNAPTDGRAPKDAWWILRKPDSLATARAGAAALMAAPGVLPKGKPNSDAGSPDPAAALQTMTGIVCAAVVGVASTEDGEADPVTLVMSRGEANPDAGRLYVGDLPPVTYQGILSAAITLIGEGGDDLARFLAA